MLRRLCAVALALLTIVPATPATAEPLSPPATGAGHDPHTLLVRFAPGIATASREHALARHGASVVGKVAGGSFVKLRTVGDAGDVLRALQKESTVEAVALDRYRRPSVVPNDPLYADGSQPYLSTVRLPEAWDLVRDASSEVIAVVDTGVDHLHPDLAGRTVPGYNVVNPAEPPTDYPITNPPSFGGHGTRVAGVAAANTNNGTGIAGAAWTGSIMPIKVFRTNGIALDSDIATGLVWAVDHGARVINLSLGGPGDSPVLHEAIRYATDNGALVVAAGGNSADDTPQYPAAFPEVLAVGATDSAGVLTSFSTRGDWIDIAAPGYKITSTIPSSDRRLYLSGDGTSFSAPMVSGVAALVRARFPALTPAQVHARLRETTRDAGPHGIDQFYGHGILDALHAVGGPAGAPFPRPAFRLREPNDVPARAETMLFSASNAAIEVEGDVDWFRYESASARMMEFRVTPPFVDNTIAQNLDPIVAVYDAQLRWLGEADSRGPGGIESLFLHIGPGTHYISVRNYNSGRLAATYEVRVATVSTPPPAFQAPLAYPVGSGSQPNTVALGDVTGDGRADALLTTRSGGSDEANRSKLFVFAQNADGSLAAPVRYPTRLNYTDDTGAGMGVLDVDGDGRLDVALATTAGVEILQQTGSGTLAPGWLLPDSTGAARLAAADMDADGKADLVVGGIQGILLYAHEPAGGLVRSSVSPDRPGEIEVGDVDGDGRPDIVGFSGTRVQVYHRGDAGWSRTEHETVRADSYGVSGVEVADVSGDGRADIVAALGGNYPSSRINVFRQTAEGALSTPDVYQTRDIPEPIEAADVDGDSRADVVTVHGGHRLLSTLTQRTDGTLGTPLTNTLPYATRYNVQGLVLGDVNGDGRTDAVIADYNNGMLVLGNQAARAPGREQLWVRDMTPADFAVGVARDAAPSVALQRVLDPASVNGSTVSLVHGLTGAAVPATLSVDPATNSVTVHPTAPLDGDTPYRIIIGAVRDQTGTVHTGRFTTTFRTAP